MAKVDIWMPIYIGDYIADTMRLSTEQHGAYLLMLMEEWMTGPLPDDDEELAAITKLPLDRWLKIREKLSRFYTIRGGKWTQQRLEKEKIAAQNRRDASSENGKKGGRPRKSETQKKPIGKPAGKPIGKPTENPEGNLQKSSSPSPSPTSLTTQENPSLPRDELSTEIDNKWGAA